DIGPRWLPDAVRGRLEAVVAEDRRDRAARNLVIEVRQGTLDPRVAPGAMLLGHAHDQRSDLVHDRRASGTTTRTAVELLADESPVPRQQRVWCDNRGDLAQQPSPQCPGFRGESTAVVVGEAQAPGP